MIVIDRMMAENPAAYVGDDVSSANSIVLMTATSLNLMHDQEQLAPYIEHVMLQSTDVEHAHRGVRPNANTHSAFLARDNRLCLCHDCAMCYRPSVRSSVRLSVCPSVCHTVGSVKNG